MNNYELGVILRPTLSEEEVNSAVEKLKNFIEERGEVVKVDLWGRRKLAYPIQKYQEGYYVFFNFKFPFRSGGTQKMDGFKRGSYPPSFG